MSSSVEKCGREFLETELSPDRTFANRTVNFDRPPPHCPSTTEQPTLLFFFLVSDPSRSTSFYSFFPLLFFFDRIFYENSLDSPVIDNVFVIPQRAAGQREIRSAGKNDDRGKNLAPFPRGNHVEEAMDGAWNG